MATQVSPHFTLEEFACHDGTPYPEEWRADRLAALLRVLETVREAAGKPVVVNSGYRTLEYDGRLYEASPKDGSKAPPDKSQHPQGRAADIHVPGMATQTLHDLVVWLWRGGHLPDLGGLGLYPSFIHVDVRPHTDHLAQWSY